MTQIVEWVASLPETRRLAVREALEAMRGDVEGNRAQERLDELISALDGARPEANEVRFVDKLAAAGRLSPDLLVTALADGQLGIFEAALARLGGYERSAIAAAVRDEAGPDGLALALAGADIDRSAFPDLLAGVRALSGGRPGGGAAGARRGLAAFGPFPAKTSARAFRALWQAAPVD
ncbi:MAG TPA: DUF2336 domain-containing protein [Caulobacteraceae bacterium]|nr:DUF2336 domain-containing protein [Caulobacteraceae bacterium]